MKKDRLRTELITKYMEENRLSKRQFCKLCGITVLVFDKMFRQDFKIGISKFLKVCKILKKYPSEMFTEE